MNNKNHTIAKILVLIPIVVFAINALIIGPLIIHYFSTGSDVTAVAIIFAGTVSLILTTLPSLIISIVGTVFASQAKKEGIVQSRKIFVIGIVEIVVYGIGVMLAIGAFLITIFNW